MTFTFTLKPECQPQGLSPDGTPTSGGGANTQNQSPLIDAGFTNAVAIGVSVAVVVLLVVLVVLLFVFRRRLVPALRARMGMEKVKKHLSPPTESKPAPSPANPRGSTWIRKDPRASEL